MAFLLFYLLVIPLSTLLHEIGHAIGFVISTKDGIAKVYLGTKDSSNKENFRIGRIYFHIRWHYVGYCVYTYEEICKYQRITILIFGPLFSLLICFTLYILVLMFNITLNYFLLGIFLYNLLQFIVTIIPIKYPSWWWGYGGMSSDGYKILKCLKS
ncbi:hypothetical protein [Bacillus testis]|uniref:hypothetical protein n=1 Tax=Bacillus testis TaxID=1622072 RepID=UPI00067E9F37|nr:hypothetical protein [Bacillus testis]